MNTLSKTFDILLLVFSNQKFFNQDYVIVFRGSKSSYKLQNKKKVLTIIPKINYNIL